MTEHGATDAQGAAGEGGETLYWAGYTVLERTGQRPQDADSPAVPREAEFTYTRAPAFARGAEAQKSVCVYPFVRSYEWYYMNPQRRGEMLKNHGMKAREYPQVLANTIACFGLNDFEWLLALEAPELVDLVDIMRHCRNTEARLHVREETPFYTGRRITTHEIAEVLD